MTEARRLQHDLEEALILAMVLIDAPFAHSADEPMYHALVERLVKHLSYETVFARRLVYAFEDYRTAVGDPNVARVVRKMKARHALKLAVHSVLRQKLGELCNDLERRGVEIRRTPADAPGPDEVPV